MLRWRIHTKAETVSTNLDAAAGAPGDVFTADFQTGGRGRLDHKWLSAPGTNLLMSVVLDVAGLSPETVSTLPLAVGLSVAEGLSQFLRRGLSPQVKWPNDVLVEGRKLSGILCERRDDRVIAGIGVNVGETAFPPEIAGRATSLALLGDGDSPSTPAVRDAVLAALGRICEDWRRSGFAAVYPRLREIDFLRGQSLSVWQTDGDPEPIRGLCGGICPDGTLDVGGRKVYAGEAHVEKIG